MRSKAPLSMSGNHTRYHVHDGKHWEPWLQVDMLRMEGGSAMKDQALRLCEQFNAMHKFEGSFWVSATRASGVQKLKDYLFSRSARQDRASFWGPSRPQLPCLRLQNWVMSGAAPLQVPRQRTMITIMASSQLCPR